MDTAKSRWPFWGCRLIKNAMTSYRILKVKPEPGRERHRTMMKLLETTLKATRPINVPEHFLRPKESVRKTWNWDSSDSEDGNNTRKHTPASTALHYASLLSDIQAVDLLLRYGADWKVVDDYNQRAEDYAAISMDDKKFKKCKCLCDAMPIQPPKSEEKKGHEELGDERM